MEVKKLNRYKEFTAFLSEKENIKIFGASTTTEFMLNELNQRDPALLKKITCITATRVEGKPSQMHGIPVIPYTDAQIGKGDHVILCMKNTFCQEVQGLLEQTGAEIVQYSSNIHCEYSYQKVFSALKPFIEEFPSNSKDLLPPVSNPQPRIWTMWWQGEEAAPEIVKACIRSQRSSLPDNISYVVITEKNYSDYVTLPDYILEKVRSGSIMLAHLSDIIRWLLLYQYGGLWIDATVLFLKPFPEKLLDCPLYSRIEATESYGTDLLWTMFFIGAQPGHPLFQFLATMLLKYLENHNSIMDVDYLMSDYTIGIAYNTFPEIRRAIDAIPKEQTVCILKGSLLPSPYNAERFAFYTKDRDWVKLSYRIDWRDCPYEGSVYEYICHNF